MENQTCIDLEKTCLVRIGDIENEKFFIPCYQRGYRWTEEQTKLLLDDILENTKDADGVPERTYCLQPVIVSRKPDGGTASRWEVIDGQQRLATLDLVLGYLGGSGFDLEYERYGKEPGGSGSSGEAPGKRIIAGIRDWESEEDPLEPDCYGLPDTIDNYHLFRSALAIRDWFRVGESAEKGKDFNDRMLDRIRNRVSVIWRPVEREDRHQEFIRFNSDRILLTPAELLKGVFLAAPQRKGGGSPLPRRSPDEIAAEWDEMESALRDENFWNFLNPSSAVRSAPNRIAFLFALAEEKSDPKDLPGTSCFLDVSRGGTDLQEKWMKLRRMFFALREWHGDRSLYHAVGFLRWARRGRTGIGELWERARNPERDFRGFLSDEIKKRLPEPKGDGEPDPLNEFRYGENNDVLHNILLWFNIATLPEPYRYPFEKHKATKWSLEHIFPQSPDFESDEEKFEDWKMWCKEELERIKKSDEARSGKAGELMERLENLALTDKTKDGGGESIFLDVEEFLVGSHLGDDHLSNLALLGRDENSSLKAMTFPKKRRKILEFESAPKQFIPPATERAFLKGFPGADIENMTLWTRRDREAYLSAVRKCLAEIHNHQSI